MDATSPLAALHLQSRATWPTIQLELKDFAEHAAARGFDPEGPQANLAADLYLACACARGLPPALLVFEQRVLPKAREALLRRSLPHSQVDEVLQGLLEHLLVAREDRAPRIGDYDARGPLTAWVRTAAVRLALNSLRGAAARPTEDLVSGLVSGQDLELQALKERYREDFSAALTEAFGRLELRDRSMLRMHLLDNVASEHIGRIHGVSRATITRWLKTARDTLFAHTREALRERLGVSEEDFSQLAPLLLSQLDLSVRRLLDSGDDEGAGSR